MGQTTPRTIPGINAKDLFPKGCVDCHVHDTEKKMDLRFSTLLKQWTVNVEPELLNKVAGAAPSGLKLKGKHPSVLGALKSIPKSCLQCHGSGSKTAPAFSLMMHTIHLTGGKANRFLMLHQGECTHCHKMNAATGAWTLPSGPGQ